MKLKILFFFICAAVISASQQQFYGSWSFIYYTNAPSADGIMPPSPVFDALVLRENGQAELGIRLKGIFKNVPYTLENNVLQFQIPIESGSIPFNAKIKLSKNGEMIMLEGKNAAAAFIRYDLLKPAAALAGVWKGGTAAFQETMTLDDDGLFQMKNSGLTGFFKLWTDKDGIDTMTLLAGRPGSQWHSFLWQVKRNANSLKMIPISTKGPQHKFTTLWELE